jgi:signal peptidase I
VSVDGVVLNEPFISIPSNIANETWKLAPNQFFVMGDNRDNSLDSRFWGPLDKGYIVGKVVLSYWPLNEVSLINTFPAVFAAIHPKH